MIQFDRSCKVFNGILVVLYVEIYQTSGLQSLCFQSCLFDHSVHTLQRLAQLHDLLVHQPHVEQTRHMFFVEL